MTAAGQPAPAAASKGSPYVELTKVRARNISIRIDQSTGWREPEWPVVVGSIPPQADCYQDRPAALAKLIGTATGRTAVHAEPARVVSGLGGVGKTQLAAGHARQLCQDKAVDVLVWVPASTRTGIVTRFAQAAEAVGAAAADDPEAACERFLGWLASTDRPWLIVFDDLAAADDVRGLWPPDYRPDGRTVVTTRRRDASLLAGRQLIDLEVFTVEEAGAYLRERLPAELADDIGGVATDLGCLPLALAQAAALMLDTELPCSGYRERFADRRRRLAEAFPHPDTLFDDTTATVATTWSISIEQANRLPPAGLAGRLLELASVLDPNGIPTAVFTTADALTFLTKDIAPTNWWRRRRRRAALTDDSVREGLANLRRFNLVAVAGSVIQVHALVQRAARDHFGPAEAQTVVQAAADALLNTWPDHARDATLTALLRANATNLAGSRGCRCTVAFRTGWALGAVPGDEQPGRRRSADSRDRGSHRTAPASAHAARTGPPVYPDHSRVYGPVPRAGRGCGWCCGGFRAGARRPAKGARGRPPTRVECPVQHALLAG